MVARLAPEWDDPLRWMTTTSLIICCLEPDCPLHGRRNAGNLSIRARYGKRRDIRPLPYKACDPLFSERKGAPLFHSCLPGEKAASVLQHLVGGNGVRQTERLAGVHRDTAMRLARKAGQHARDGLMASSPRGA
jgi:transposase-like protein